MAKMGEGVIHTKTWYN